MYYNTTNESGSILKDYTDKAVCQDERILAFMSDGEPRSPSEIQNQVFANAPITSVRRSLTNLTKAGLLTKTDGFIIGSYGRKEHRWIIKDAPRD